MDVAQAELSRICFTNNRYSWCLENDENESHVVVNNKNKNSNNNKMSDMGDDHHRYYMLDQALGTNEYGDTSLHRLVALHAPPIAIMHFLHHLEAHQHAVLMRDMFHHSAKPNEIVPSQYIHLPDPPSMMSQNKHGCTALHVAVHRNSWQVDVVVKMLLDKCPKLASIPMSSTGTYPLHIVTGHSVTIHPVVIDTLIKADPTVTMKEDVNGCTPLSLLWMNVMRFRWARNWEVMGIAPKTIEKQSADASWMTMIAPDQFRDYALRLIQPYYPQGEQIVTWHDICSVPRCPPLLIRLLLHPSQQQYVIGSLFDRDEYGRLPLHCAAGATPVSSQFLPDDLKLHAPSILEVILRYYLRYAPTAASIFDDDGSLPLHYALRRKSALPRSSDIIALIRAYPDALLYPDPVTNLYPAQQLASRLAPTTGTNFDGADVDMVDTSTTTTDTSTTPTEGENSRAFDVLYCMIRSNPEVVTFHRTG